MHVRMCAWRRKNRQTFNIITVYSYSVTNCCRKKILLFIVITFEAMSQCFHALRVYIMLKIPLALRTYGKKVKMIDTVEFLYYYHCGFHVSYRNTIGILSSSFSCMAAKPAQAFKYIFLLNSNARNNKRKVYGIGCSHIVLESEKKERHILLHQNQFYRNIKLKQIRKSFWQ